MIARISPTFSGTSAALPVKAFSLSMTASRSFVLVFPVDPVITDYRGRTVVTQRSTSIREEERKSLSGPEVEQMNAGKLIVQTFTREQAGESFDEFMGRMERLHFELARERVATERARYAEVGRGA